MRVKAVIDESFNNYKKPAMFIGTISCGGKCCTEANLPLSVCQNDPIRHANNIEIPDETLCERYLDNPITEAIVFGGLEPFEQFEEMIHFIRLLRMDYECQADIVIYTGFYPHEIQNEIRELQAYGNIIVKFGRFIPNMESVYDSVLGVKLSSLNQFAERIS